MHQRRSTRYLYSSCTRVVSKYLYLNMQYLSPYGHFCFLFTGALATWSRWLAMASAFTVGWLVLGQFWAAARRWTSDQLLQLHFVKFICSVVSSQRRQRAASNDSIRWSATSVSPVSWSWSSRTWHSSSRHEMYLGLNPLGMEKWAAFIRASVKRWHDLYWYAVHWNQRNRTLSCGSIFRPVCFPEIPSTFVDASHDW